MKIFDLLAGYKTYIIGFAMILHALSQVLMDFSSGNALNQINVTEFFGGLGLISARRASQMGR